MSDETDNLLLERLSPLRNEVYDFRRDAREKPDRVERRLELSDEP